MIAEAKEDDAIEEEFAEKRRYHEKHMQELEKDHQALVEQEEKEEAAH